MLTLSELQDNENNFHIPQPEATRPHLGGMCPHLGATRSSTGDDASSTWQCTCFHWPVDVFPLASVHVSTGQWTTAE